jgi:hypothetical protein
MSRSWIKPVKTVTSADLIQEIGGNMQGKKGDILRYSLSNSGALYVFP